MSIRLRVLGLLDVILRVPPLFVIDEILKISMGLGHLTFEDEKRNYTTNVLTANGTDDFERVESEINYISDASEFYKFLSLTTLKFLTCLLGCACAVCVFMLWTRHLAIVYMYIFSVGLIFLSYWSNISAINLITDGPSLLEDILSLNMTNILDPGGVAVSILPHFLAQWLIGLIFAYIHLGPRNDIVQKLIPYNFLMPLLLAMLPLPHQLLKHSPAFAAILPLVLSKIAMWSSSFDVAKTLFNGYQHARNFASNFGLSALVENEWQRLNVPCVLRAFWILRIIEQLLSTIIFSKEVLPWLTAAQSLLVGGCETLTAVLGMTSIVSVICHYIGKLFQLFLLSEDYDEDKSIGTVSAILFYILALQTGLTSLTPDKRFVRLCRNFCLLITALLHFFHNIVAPILMSLSAARNPSKKRHARALLVCLFLLVAPIALLTVLWTKHSPSTWLLAVTAFSVEVIVKVHHDVLTANGTDDFERVESEINYISDASEFYKFLSLTTLKFLTCLLGCACAVCVFMLWTRHLAIVYMYIFSVGLIFLSYWSNISAINLITDGPSLLEDILSLNMTNILDPGGVAVSILPHFLAQWLIGLIFAYIHLGPRNDIVQKLIPYNFLMPLLLAMLPLPHQLLKHSPAFAAILPLVLSKIAMWSSSFDVAKTLFNGYQHARNFASNFGLSALVENEWQRLNVPCVLRAFWILRIIEQLFSTIIFSKEVLPWLTAAQSLLVGGCETLTAVLGMTSIVSVICHYIGKLFQLFLLSEDYDEDKSIGTVSAILFYILALQTGLTSLTPDKRFVRLCRNFCLLITALLHFFHNIVAPILMSLSAARNPSKKRHARALLVCLFLLVAPIALLTVLWTKHSPSTWLLAVTAFSVEVIVKVLVSIATYTLFLLDARRQTFWEKLDDYVYYIRAFGNSVEFCFGIFLFFNGAWILVFESGGAIRALMMGIHAYFNIWCEARAGWAVFMKRRTAVHKISSLPEANEHQLRTLDDVCAICYQEMTSAKITRCRHYFHGVCLRKWLYVQDRCPLCHEIIMHQEPVPNEKHFETEQNDNSTASRNIPLQNAAENVVDILAQSSSNAQFTLSAQASLVTENDNTDDVE